MRLFAALFVSALFAAAPFEVSAEPKAAPVSIDRQVALNAYQGLVEEHLNGVLRTAKAIATSREAQSASWDQVRPMLERFSQDLETDATVWFAMPDGSYYSTEAGGLTTQNLKDRAYFPGLMNGQMSRATLS
jgi:hypothetical protein